VRSEQQDLGRHTFSGLHMLVSGALTWGAETCPGCCIADAATVFPWQSDGITIDRLFVIFAIDLLAACGRQLASHYVFS